MRGVCLRARVVVIVRARVSDLLVRVGAAQGAHAARGGAAARVAPPERVASQRHRQGGALLLGVALRVPARKGVPAR